MALVFNKEEVRPMKKSSEVEKPPAEIKLEQSKPVVINEKESDASHATSKTFVHPSKAEEQKETPNFKLSDHDQIEEQNPTKEFKFNLDLDNLPIETTQENKNKSSAWDAL